MISCIAHYDNEWILVVPCDIPYLLDNLVKKPSETECRLTIAKARHQRQRKLLVHYSLIDNLNQFMRQGHKKAMSWIELQKIVVVVFETDDG